MEFTMGHFGLLLLCIGVAFLIDQGVHRLAEGIKFRRSTHWISANEAVDLLRRKFPFNHPTTMAIRLRLLARLKAIKSEKTTKGWVYEKNDLQRFLKDGSKIHLHAWEFFRTNYDRKKKDI